MTVHEDMRKPFETADCANYGVLKANAKNNRNNPTEAESCLWHHLSKDELGVRFRRQYVIDNFIVDFVCLKKKLIIEIDGGYHFEENQQLSDEARTSISEKLGFRVIRFTNEEVLFDIETTISKIKNIIS